MGERKALEVALEGGEVALKQTIDNSLLKDVPVVGTLAKLYDVGASVRDRLYAAKISSFLTCLDEIPERDRVRFRETIRTGREEAERLSEKIFLAIEIQTDLEKSEIIANIFLAYLDEQIDAKDFRRAVDVTASSFLDDLKDFLKGDGIAGFMHEKFEGLERKGIAGLVNSPLIEIDQTTPEELRRDGWREDADLVLYRRSDFGATYKSAYHYGRRLREQGAGDG